MSRFTPVIKKSLASGMGASLFLVAGTALAGHEGNYYGSSAGGQYGDYAQVVNVTPAYSYQQVQVPVQNCRQQPSAFRGHDGGLLSSTTGQTVIGGVIGAALGNQIGDGRGRDIATVAGGLIGASIGANRAQRQQYQHGYTTQPVCHTSYRTRSERVNDGYDVTYRYAGRTYHTRMAQHPGNRVRVNVDVQPQYDGQYGSHYQPTNYGYRRY